MNYTFNIDESLDYNYYFLYFDKDVHDGRYNPNCKYIQFTTETDINIIPDAILKLRKGKDLQGRWFENKSKNFPDSTEIFRTIYCIDNTFKLASYTNKSINIETICKQFLSYDNNTTNDSYVCFNGEHTFKLY